MNLETKPDPRLWDAIRATYETRNFTGAISDAMYFVSDLIRERTGLESDGTSLVGQAFGGSAPRLKVSPLQTDSDWNVQKGVEQLLRGMYQAIRNPRSHGKLTDSEEDSQAIILFINYLVKLIGQSKSPFSKLDFIARVFDADFVASSRYADLLVSEIPPKKRLEVFLDVYAAKGDGDGSKLSFFFASVLKQLTDEDKQAVYDCISRELRVTDDETVVIKIIRSFEPRIWPNLEESSRLRIENKLIQSIKKGSYVRATKTCRTGSFGTWGRRLFTYFTLKSEALWAIRNQLTSSDRFEQDYIFEFLFSFIDGLADKPPQWLEELLIEGLEAGDERFFDAINGAWLWSDSDWSAPLNDAVKNFKSAGLSPDLTDDDVPF